MSFYSIEIEHCFAKIVNHAAVGHLILAETLKNVIFSYRMFLVTSDSQQSS